MLSSPLATETRSVFTPSSVIASAARSMVASAAGLGDDPEGLAQAGLSLNAIAQRWNRQKWKFLQTEQYVVVSGPFTVAGVACTGGSATITTTVASGFASVLVDDLLTGPAVRAESLVQSGTGSASTAL